MARSEVVMAQLQELARACNLRGGRLVFDVIDDEDLAAALVDASNRVIIEANSQRVGLAALASTIGNALNLKYGPGAALGESNEYGRD